MGGEKIYLPTTGKDCILHTIRGSKGWGDIVLENNDLM